MSDNFYTFRDESFSPARAHAYRFLLLVNSGTFSFAVAEDQKLLLWANNVPIGDLIAPKELTEVLNAHYKEKIVGLGSAGFTLVPNELYSDGSVAGLARLLDVRPSEKVFASELDKDNHIVFKAADATVTAISSKFDIHAVVFGAKGWIKRVEESSTPSNTIYINFSPKSVELLNVKNNKLRFYNRFEITSENDLSYFAIMVTSELKMQPQQVSLVLSGSINENDSNVRRLRDFFKSVTLNDMQVLTLPQQVAPHQIFPLAALSLCASLVAH